MIVCTNKILLSAKKSLNCFLGVIAADEKPSILLIAVSRTCFTSLNGKCLLRAGEKSKHINRDLC